MKRLSIAYLIFKYILGFKHRRSSARGSKAQKQTKAGKGATAGRRAAQSFMLADTVRHLAIFSAVTAAAGLIISEYEKSHPVYAAYRMDSRGRVQRPVRLVFLTDLHDKEFDAGNQKLLDMVEAASPDAVLIGGDMSTAYMAGHKGRKRARQMKKNKSHISLTLCGALAERYPVFYGLGNHEVRMPAEYMREIRQMGIRVLDDETAEFMGLELIGITLPGACYRRPAFARPDMEHMRELMSRTDPNRYRVMLAHSPNFLKEYAEAGTDLVLSGHFHGGTIRIGEHTGLMTPQYQLFDPNCHGMRSAGDTDMIVSAGLGTHTVNVRINDLPEVVVVDIV